MGDVCSLHSHICIFFREGKRQFHRESVCVAGVWGVGGVVGGVGRGGATDGIESRVGSVSGLTRT